MVLLLNTDRKALQVDDCGLTLQTRRRQNASKRENFNVTVAVRGSKTSVLKFPYGLWQGVRVGGEDNYVACSRLLERRAKERARARKLL